MSDAKAKPVDIRLHQKSRQLQITYDDDSQFMLSCEYLRVMSPSAEVQGHGPGQEVLQIGKENVNIVEIEPVGNYAVRLVFDDGHDSGLYSWDFLYGLGTHQEKYFNDYLEKLKAAGHTRNAEAAPAAAKSKVIKI